MGEGTFIWTIPDGFIPEGSSGEQTSHEAICILNTSGEEARIYISFYFEDRTPVKGIRIAVSPERTRHLRTDLPDQIDGVTIPRGVPYAVRVESSVPITVQHSRMDTSSGRMALMSTIAYPVTKDSHE